MFNLKLSKMMKDIQWSFISLVTASFSHLLLRIVIGKELGPSGLGLYTLVFTLYMFGMQFAAFGIGVSLTKYIAQYHEDLPKIREYVTSGMLGSMISGTVMGILLYLLSGTISIQFFHNPEMTDLLKITAFCFPFIAMQKVVIGTFNGMRKMKLYAIVNIVQNISVMVASIVLVMMLDMGVKGAVLGYVMPTIVVGVLSLSIIRKYLSIKQAIMRTTLVEISWFGFYVVLANSIGMISTHIDILMVGYFMDEAEVGYYAVAIVLIQGMTLLPNAVQAVTTAAIARYYGKNDYENIIKLIKKSVIMIFAINILISLLLILFGHFLIKMVFGTDFLSAYTPLLVLLVGYFIYTPIHSVNGTLPSIGKVTIMFKISFVGVVINTFLNILLIPIYGIAGAAIATSIALIFITVLRVYFIYIHTSKHYSDVVIV